MFWKQWSLRLSLLLLLATTTIVLAAEDYNIQHNDGSYEFGYENPDSFHHSKATSRNVVRGEFGGRNPKSGGIDVTSYTAGPRGYRPRGKNIARKFDQSQVRRGPIGSRDDPYFDPNEDPSYDFGFKTRTYQRKESANRLGDVNGQYSYLDDVGERHNVEYVAGKTTGFHVKTPFPDSNPRAYGPLFYNGRGRPIPRGRTSIQRGLDGSYRFVAAGPDQRRTEVSDSQGNVRGSYTYLDDKGVQHSVHYIAGSGIGYRVLKNVKGPHLPSVYPFTGPNIVPPDFYNYIDKHSQGDAFNSPETSSGSGPSLDYENGGYDYSRPSRPNRPNSKPSGAVPRPRPTQGSPKPSYNYDDDESDLGGDDLFGGSTGSAGTTVRPSGSAGTQGRPGSTGQNTNNNDDDVTGAGTGSDDDNDYDGGGDLFGDGPSPKPPVSSAARPKPTHTPSRPSYSGEDDDNDLDNGLFGSGGSASGSSSGSSLNSGSSTEKPHVISISSAGGKKTIVTNLGDRIFTVPPGVSVHAHVQSIDLYPYESKVPSPADQFRSETTKTFQRLTTRQVNKVDENHVIQVTEVSNLVESTTESSDKNGTDTTIVEENDTESNESKATTTTLPTSTNITKTIK